MRPSFCFSLLLLGLASPIVAQDGVFEEPGFNVTEALGEYGVDISKIPELVELVESTNDTIVARSQTTFTCPIACSSLQLLYRSQVLTPNTAAYDSYMGTYWSLIQSSASPRCVFQPADASQVAVAILLSRLTLCPFSIRSGGHAAFAGASTTENGITVSLKRFNEVTVSRDRKTVTVGAGNTWFDVYSKLDAQGLTVPGGRDAGVGAGGLSLGGGISFFSSKVGMTCDNIDSYQIVTASGLTLTVSPTLFPDLYWALRGGGSNFGVVVSYTFKAIAQNGIWGGSRPYLESANPALISAFISVATAEDPKAGQILAFARTDTGMRISNAQVYYTEPEGNATTFAKYLAVPNPLSDTFRSRSVSDLTLEIQDTSLDSERQVWWTQSSQIDEEHARFLVDTFYQELDTLGTIQSFRPALILQHIDRNMMSFTTRNGGNPLGIGPSSKPMILYFTAFKWVNAADDQKIYAMIDRFMKRAAQNAESKGLGSKYLYLNYGSMFQDPIASYGSTNQQKLQQIARKYDPTQVFQNLMPGGFKLSGTPADRL